MVPGSSASGLRFLLGSLASFGLLMQVMFAAPLMARMMVDVPVCTIGGGASDHAPATPHNHELCLLCHAGALPIGLISAADPPPLPRIQTWRADLPLPASTGAFARLWRYRSRAPPAIT
jgi:hypothetical protein